MTKRICVLTSAHPAFDVRIFHKECKSLVRAGYDVTLIAPYGEDLARGGVQVKAIRQRTGRLRRITLTTWDALVNALRENGDLYHFHDPELIPVGLTLRLCGKRVVYDIHEDLPKTLAYKQYLPEWLKPLLVRTLDFTERCASRVFSGLIVATPFLKDRFERCNRNVAVIANYPLIDEFSAVRDPENCADSSLVDSFIYVGMRITAARGAKEMVEAVGLLKEGAQLDLVGEFDPPELQKTLAGLAGWRRVKVHGFLGRDEISRAISRSTAGLVTLHPEPNYLTAFPVKLFEYMAAGIPVIASDFPACREIVEQAGCGLLVDPLNPKEIANAMRFLQENPDEAREMGERGRTSILGKMNWTNEEKQLLRLYEKLLVERPEHAGEAEGCKLPS